MHVVFNWVPKAIWLWCGLAVPGTVIGKNTRAIFSSSQKYQNQLWLGCVRFPALYAIHVVDPRYLKDARETDNKMLEIAISKDVRMSTK